jgi:PGF-CTERM protein
VSAEAFTDLSYYSELYNNITLASSTSPTTWPVLIGQDLLFWNHFGYTVTIQGDPANDNVAGELFTADTQGKFDTAVMTKTGVYYVNATVAGTNVTSAYAKLAVANPTMTLDLKSAGTSVTSITQGTALQVAFTNNLNGSDMVSLVITDPDGDIIKRIDPPTYPVSQLYDLINVSYLTNSYGVGNTTAVNTSAWKLGDYKFKVSTKKNATGGNHGARGLEMSSNEKTLSILKSAINIDAEKTSAIQNETIKITVTGVANHVIMVNTSDVGHTVFPRGSNDNPAAGDVSSFVHSIDADGTRTYTVRFTSTGSFTLTVTDNTAVPATTDTVDFTISEPDVTFDVPATVVIGQKITIKGTANTGKTVDIAVEGKMYTVLNDVVIDANKQFSKEYDTASGVIPELTVPGSVRLKAYLDRDTTAGDIQTGELDDGSVAILLVRGDLTAEISVAYVAQDDDFTITGTAKGAKKVDIVIVSPKGSGGTYIDGTQKGLYMTTASVSETDQSFSKKVTVGRTVDTGVYAIAVLAPGADGLYGKTGFPNLSAALDRNLGGYSIAGKTQSELWAIIEDLTDPKLTDDLTFTLYIKVETPTVKLDLLKSVGVGEPLVVTGTSNRKAGFTIVVTAKGPKELTPQTVKVAEGKFSATFDTTDAPVGTYSVKADDGDGHTDEATVEIVTAVPTAPPTVAPTATPTATPTMPPTATPAATPTPTPTPTPEEPGFEAVLAIAGLLAIAYLIHRKK